MRNLEILTKFSALLSSLQSQVELACLDEFGHILYVFTKGDAKIYTFKYTDQNIPSILTLKGNCVDLSE